MKRTLFCILVFAFPVYLAAQSHSHEEGTIVRMRMTDCLGPQHGFVTVMSGAKVESGATCPEYVLVGDRVVYVISGKTFGSTDSAGGGHALPYAEERNPDSH